MRRHGAGFVSFYLFIAQSPAVGSVPKSILGASLFAGHSTARTTVKIDRPARHQCPVKNKSTQANTGPILRRDEQIVHSDSAQPGEDCSIIEKYTSLFYVIRQVSSIDVVFFLTTSPSSPQSLSSAGFQECPCSHPTNQAPVHSVHEQGLERVRISRPWAKRPHRIAHVKGSSKGRQPSQCQPLMRLMISPCQ